MENPTSQCHPKRNCLCFHTTPTLPSIIWFISYSKFIRHLYTSVALPKILYGVSIWGSPTNIVKGHHHGNGAMICALTTIQHQAATLITGGPTSSPTDALEAHSHLLPVELLIDKYCYHSTLRLASLPKAHPLFPMIDRCTRLCPQHHLSTFHVLFCLYPTNPLLVETIQPSTQHPMRPSPFTISIPDSKDLSITADALAATEY